MIHFFRSVDNSLIDVLIVQSEECGYCYDHFLKNAPNTVNNGQFQRIFGHSFKEFPIVLYAVNLFVTERMLYCNAIREVAAICKAKLQDATVLYMGIYSSDVLGTPPSFGIVRIIHNQTGVIVADLQITDKRVKFTNQPIS